MEHASNPLALIRQRIIGARQARQASSTPQTNEPGMPNTPDEPLWRPGLDPLPEDSICPTCSRMFRAHPAIIATLAAKGMRAVGVRFCECPPGPPPSYSDQVAAQRLKYANLPHADSPRTFANFTPRRGTEGARSAAWEYATGMAGYHMLVLTGQAGTGKSHLLEAVARERLTLGGSAKYETVPHLLDVLREAYQDDAKLGFLDVFERYQAADLLVLDDLGAETVTPWVAEKLTTLVDERYRNGRDLAIATNLLREDVARTYHERLASRLWDARTGMVCSVALTATDYRALGGGRGR